MATTLLHVGTARSYFGNRHGTIKGRYQFDKAMLDGECRYYARPCRRHLRPRRFVWKSAVYRREHRELELRAVRKNQARRRV